MTIESTQIRNPKETTSLLGQIETFVFFAAMLLAITLEGACVYWLWLPGTVRAHSETQVTLVGQWTASTLPQCWLLGAVVVLVYRAVLMLMSRQTLDVDHLLHNRKAFVRLWRWVMVVGTAQMCVLYLDRVARMQ
jgi:hypothetical protein